tara:strand:+ start:535 stop:684 length:150 start_codon:yes stop_codon:yes gene_type:complete
MKELKLDEQELDYLTMVVEQNLDDEPEEYGENHKQMLEDLYSKLIILNK